MIWLAIHTAFGFECIIGDDLTWVCDKAGVSIDIVKVKYVEGQRIEVWNGEKLWVVEEVSLDRLGIVILSHLEARKPKF